MFHYEHKLVSDVTPPLIKSGDGKPYRRFVNMWESLTYKSRLEWSMRVLGAAMVYTTSNTAVNRTLRPI